MSGANTPFPETDMSDKANTEREADGLADAIAVTSIIGLIVLTACIWLSGMPG
jgi:hypothetical protein